MYGRGRVITDRRKRAGEEWGDPSQHTRIQEEGEVRPRQHRQAWEGGRGVIRLWARDLHCRGLGRLPLATSPRRSGFLLPCNFSDGRLLPVPQAIRKLKLLARCCWGSKGVLIIKSLPATMATEQTYRQAGLVHAPDSGSKGCSAAAEAASSCCSSGRSRTDTAMLGDPGRS